MRLFWLCFNNFTLIDPFIKEWSSNKSYKGNKKSDFHGVIVLKEIN